MRKALPRLSILLLWGLLASLAGCFPFSGGETGDMKAFDTPAQVLATEAETLYRDGEYDDAAELYQQIKDRFPYSRFALLADLRVGDAYRKAKRYEEAVLAYDDFIRLHPKNEAVPYALYQMGMVYHDQMLTPDRDPTFARKAAETFQRLTQRFPNSEWTAKAQPRWQEAMAQLAGHDFFVGEFYFRTKHYEAAIGRFKRVLTKYPDVGYYRQAMEYIQRCQRRIARLSPEERSKEYDERRHISSPANQFEGLDILQTTPGKEPTDESIMTTPR